MELKKVIVLEDELRIAEEYLYDGLRRMRNEFQGSNHTYHHTLLSLSQGYERLLKVTLSFKYYEDNQVFPTKKEFQKNYGHDLTKLWSRLEQLIVESTNDNSWLIKKNLEILSNITHFRDFLQLISSFAKESRYYNLDVISGSMDEVVASPHGILSKQYNDFFKSVPEWHLRLTYGNIRERIIVEEQERVKYTRVVREYILLSLQIITRTLSWGLCGGQAPQISAGKLTKVLMLSENDIIMNLDLDFC